MKDFRESLPNHLDWILFQVPLFIIGLDTIQVPRFTIVLEIGELLAFKSYMDIFYDGD